MKRTAQAQVSVSMERDVAYAACCDAVEDFPGLQKMTENAALFDIDAKFQRWKPPGFVHLNISLAEPSFGNTTISIALTTDISPLYRIFSSAPEERYLAEFKEHLDVRVRRRLS